MALVMRVKAHFVPGALGEPFCLGLESSSQSACLLVRFGVAGAVSLCCMCWSKSPSRRCFRLKGRRGSKPYPDRLRRAGEAGVELADKPGDVLGGVVGQVRVASEVVGDDFGSVLGAEPGRLEEHLGRKAEPVHDTSEVRQVGEVAFLDSCERVERDVRLVGRGAQAEASSRRWRTRVPGLDIDGYFHSASLRR